LRLQLLERVGPEPESDDVAFVRQEVVPDVQPRHRGEMRAHDPIDDKRGHRGGVVSASFKIVQRRGTRGRMRLVLLVPFRDARVQIPTVVVESRAVGDFADGVDRPVLQVAEADDDVGNLDAEIVDVVLYFDRRTAKLQHPRERIAERGVAKVSDMRRFVRIDRGVFDDGLLRRRDLERHLLPDTGQQIRRPIQVEIQVPVWRRRDPRDS
jgi:hypothetical protein